MENKYNPLILLSNTVIYCNPPGKNIKTYISSDPEFKELEILIAIGESSDKFKIKVDDKGHALLLRGSGETWRIQKPDELEMNKDLLGDVTVSREGKSTPEFYGHTFDAYWERMKRKI